jgi:ribokinase
MITVLGSINMDLVTTTNKNPSMGETVLGEKFSTIPGGKGANQAVAAARLGAKVQMIGRVGDDLYGREYVIHLNNERIDTSNIKAIANEKTGVASITVFNEDNKIIVVPGANFSLTPEEVEGHRDQIKKSDWLLLQLEIPSESVERALKTANEEGVKVILNPAPFQPIPEKWVELATYLTPNEYEANQLINLYKHNDSIFPELKQKLVVTRGAAGVSFYENDEEVMIPAPKVTAVDTTGAGDTFNGALAVALSEGKNIKEACQFAVTAVSLSVTKLGAQAGMPTREEVIQNKKKQINIPVYYIKNAV